MWPGKDVRTAVTATASKRNWTSTDGQRWQKRCGAQIQPCEAARKSGESEASTSVELSRENR